jgi:sulfur-oxidizing protein SoxY
LYSFIHIMEFIQILCYADARAIRFPSGETIMNITRRKLLGNGTRLGLGVGLGAAVAASPLLPSVGPAYAGTEQAEALIAEFTGGAAVASGKISLGAPEIAENGNTVPIKVSVESAMSEEDHVAQVLVVASANPAPGVAVFNFTPMSGKAQASTRIRLAKTQELIAVARMSDGSFYRDAKMVKVTIGGCGG